MTRISDLASIEQPPLDYVTVVSSGELTYKLALENLQNTIINQASDTRLGVVKIGEGLDINETGTISVKNYSGYSLPTASTSTLGGIVVGDGLSINPSGVLSAILDVSIASRTEYGNVKIGDGITVVDGIISVQPFDNTFNDSGITIGNDSDLKLYVKDSTIPSIKSLNNGIINLEVVDSHVADNVAEARLISSSVSSQLGGALQPAFIPDVSGESMNLGISTLPWNNVYATNFYGNFTGNVSKADTLLVNSDYRSASIPVVSNTIPARDSSGNLFANTFIGNLTGIASNSTISELSNKAETVRVGSSYLGASVSVQNDTIMARDNSGNVFANIFNGIATSAQYADLAEKYISDADYDEGTVVVFGGEYEITISKIFSDTRVAGVISTKPAYLMNVDSQGLPVALRGKVPVKVTGPVSKGDLLVSSAIPGYAYSVGNDKSHSVAIFAKSLEDKINHERGIIMAVIV